MITVQSSNFGQSTTIRATVKTGKYHVRSHIHQFSEIVFVLEGEIRISVDGKEEIAKAGDVALIPPFHFHDYYTPEYCKIWLAVFSNDFVSDFSNDGEFYYHGEKSVFTPSQIVAQLLESRMIDTNEEIVNCDARTFRNIKVAIYAVWEEYTRCTENFATVRKSGSLSTALKVVAHLKDHYTEKTSLELVAKQLGYNPEYISRCLSEIKGMNFRYLVNSFRVDRAKMLLLTTNRTMADIAIGCGFSGERSFHRTFLAMVGMTPGEYKKKGNWRI